MSTTRISSATDSTLMVLFSNHSIIILLGDTIHSFKCLLSFNNRWSFRNSFLGAFFTMIVSGFWRDLATSLVKIIDIFSYTTFSASFSASGLSCFCHSIRALSCIIIYKKKGSRRILCTTMIYLSTNGRSSHCHRSGFCCCKIQRKIVSIPFMHHL